jgi:hypothetical protein
MLPIILRSASCVLGSSEITYPPLILGMLQGRLGCLGWGLEHAQAIWKEIALPPYA